MAELAAFFLLGAVVAGLTGGLFTFWQLKHYRSKNYQTLRANLEKIGLRWNDLNSAPKDFSEGRFNIWSELTN